MTNFFSLATRADLLEEVGDELLLDLLEHLHGAIGLTIEVNGVLLEGIFRLKITIIVVYLH